MYSVIYDFVNNNLIGALPPGVTDTYITQLGTILTHTGIVLFYLLCVVLLITIFKIFAGFFKW